MAMQIAMMLEAALGYLERGWSVFPVTVTRNEEGKWGKKPLVLWKDFQKQIPLQEQVEQWWIRWPDASIESRTR